MASYLEILPMSWLLFFHVFALGALGLALLFLLSNLVFFRSLRIDARPRPAGRVSILIPARNEELRIGPCATSLAAQDYPDFEVLVLNDNSEDDTAGVLEHIGFAPTGKLRVITGAPLPPGWTGKAWACHQLALAAGGDFLFFTDADTWHRPQTVSAALAMMQETRADLLSAWPRLLTRTFGERAVIPMILFFAMAMFPHGVLLFLQRYPRLALKLPPSLRRNLGAANGQFLFFRRDAYARIGGHESVRRHMVEDVALGREITRRIAEGMRLINCDGSRLCECRMYTSFAEVWEGFSKNARAAFEGSIASFWIIGMLQSAVCVLPFFLVVSAPFRELALMEVALIYVIRALIAWRFRSSWLGALLHPIGNLLIALISLNSLRLSLTTGLSWKGRTYAVTRESAELQE